MGKVRFNVTMSLDGYVAGPRQSEENPLGIGGMDLHSWLVELEAWRSSHGQPGGEVSASTRVAKELEGGYGAVVMGRKMFGPVRGPWEGDAWKGWWGENPPYHTPVFVVTHHARQPLEMEGGTTFQFVTGGIVAALELANRAAAGRDVLIAGGASVIRQYLGAGLIDEFWISLVPVLLEDGESLLGGLDASIELEQLEAVTAPGVTLLRFAVT